MSYDVVDRVVLERDSHLDEGAALRASLRKLAEVFGGAAPYQVRYPFCEWLPEIELYDGLGVVVVLVINRLAAHERGRIWCEDGEPKINAFVILREGHAPNVARISGLDIRSAVMAQIITIMFWTSMVMAVRLWMASSTCSSMA